jgi:hypothetical protein
MFRFTIRDVLLVMVIVGLAVGWGIDRTRVAASLERLEEYDLGKRLIELKNKREAAKNADKGRPWPVGYAPTFTNAEFDEMVAIERRLFPAYYSSPRSGRR